ncbi:hypothetical protein OAH12_01935 [Cyclobacteriaceae bacterium]|nr:hypothetical protein [Cyclobacteriaceae bacterium]
MKKTVSLLLLIICSSIAFGTDIDWNGKEEQAKPKWIYLNDLVAEKSYVEAVAPAVWLLQNTPNLSKNLYIHSAKIFKGAVKKEKDNARKIALQDSALWVWDQRIALYGEEANCLNRKGKIAWKYLKNRKGNSEELYALYKKIYELNGEKTYLKNITAYFRSAEKAFMAQKIDKAELLSVYGIVSAQFDNLETKYAGSEKNLTAIAKQRGIVEADFDKNIPLNCDEVITYYAQDFETNPTYEVAEKINHLLAKQKCWDKELFIATNNYMLEQKPDAKRYAFSAILFQKSEKYEESYDYYTKAVELETSDSLKSNYLYAMAVIKNIKKEYTTAREHAQQSISLSGANAIACHTLIGNMYLSSSTTCSSDNFFANKALYIAAYHEFKMAGNTQMMSTCKGQFPTKAEIFERNKSEGDLINTGCWIGQSVKLQVK